MITSTTVGVASQKEHTLTNISCEQKKAREEFSASLDQNRSEVKARRDEVREKYGKVMSPGRLKFLRSIAKERRKAEKK